MHLPKVFLMAILLPLTAAAADQSGSWWQLVFHYDSSGLQLVKATPFASPAKTPTTPGLAGAPIRLTYDVSWQNTGGAELVHSRMTLPLGVRSILQDSVPCMSQIPDYGCVVVRTFGPAPELGCTALTLTAASAFRRRPDLPIPPAFEFPSLTLSVPTRNARPHDGPVGVTKLRDTGPDANRLVMVIMGDGYTAANLAAGTYANHAYNVLSVFDSYGPWDILFDGSNVYRIEIASNEQGADNDPYGVYKDTYLNCSFWIGGIERLLFPDGDGPMRAIDAADDYVGPGIWDQILILVNSTKYGGGGGTFAVASAHIDAPYILLHELGHSFARLADEYTAMTNEFMWEQGNTSLSPNEEEPNIDLYGTRPGLKWLPWVLPSTPLPTPVTSPWLKVIGAFEGARYQPTGLYRPALNCLMKVLSAPFDSVCQEAHLTAYFSYVGLVDNAVPSLFSIAAVPPEGRTFTVTPLPFSGISYQWYLDDSLIADSVGPTFSLSLPQLTAHGLQPANLLKLRAAYSNIRMRLSQPSADYHWVLQPDCNSNGIDDSVDLATHVSWDVNQNGILDACEHLACCEGTTGNINGTGMVDLSDLSLLIAFLIGTPKPILPCPDEANVNAWGIIDLSDLSMLIAYLTAEHGPALPNCP